MQSPRAAGDKAVCLLKLAKEQRGCEQTPGCAALGLSLTCMVFKLKHLLSSAAGQGGSRGALGVSQARNAEQEVAELGSAARFLMTQLNRPPHCQPPRATLTPQICPRPYPRISRLHTY